MSVVRVTNVEEDQASLGKMAAEAIAAEIRAIHPGAEALVLYCFGSGGYAVVARSPLAGQDDVALLSVAAYRIFLNLRADAWKRQLRGTHEERAMAQRVEEAAMANLLLADEQEGRQVATW